MTIHRRLMPLALAIGALSAQAGAIRIGSQDVPAAQVLSLPVADSGGRVSVDTDAILEFTLPGSPQADLKAAKPTLTGASGPVALDWALAPDSRALYLRPKVALKPGTPYTLRVRHGEQNATSTLHLLVNGRAGGGGPSGVLTKDGGRWVPDLSRQRDDWFTHLPDHSLSAANLLTARNGVTALSGQVRLIGDSPLANVTLNIGDVQTRSDAQGRFLLTGLPKGGQVLTIDATTADRAGARYGVYQAHVDLEAGRTTLLPYTVWMSRLATEHAIKLASPTTADTIVRSPDIPGLELRIPKGTVIKDRDGKTVTELSITAIPIDRSPFPLPRLAIPTYFTVQPGGARLMSADGKSPRGAQLVYPNFSRERPGTVGTFWNYDPQERGWYRYGRGHVSADGRQVMPDSEVKIYSLTGAMFNSHIPTPDGPAVGGGSSNIPPQDGDDGDPTPAIHSGCGCSPGLNPIDMATGSLMRDVTDLVVQDIMPIELKRSFVQDDSKSRAFGKGWNLGYDFNLYSKTYVDPSYYKEVDLVAPDGTRIHYVRSVPGTGYSDAVLTSYGSPGRFYRSTVKWAGGGWKVSFKDGSSMWLPETSLMQSMTDRNGNTVTITRNGNYATLITSPTGKYIQLNLDASNRITSAMDFSGRIVTYAYDLDGYLSVVTYPDGTTMQYTYLTFADYPHKMLSVIKDRRGTIRSTTEFARYISTFDTQFQYGGGSSPGSTGGGSLLRNAVTSSPSSAAFTASALTSATDQGTPSEYQCLVYKPKRQIYPDGGIATIDWTLDNYCRVMKASFTDPLGHKTTREFNIDGALVKETQAVGTALERVALSVQRPKENPRFSASGGKPPVTVLPSDPTNDPGSNFIRQATDVAGRTTVFQYDSAGNAISVTTPAGTATATYNNYGFPLTVTNVLGQTTTFTYDSKGNLLSVKDAMGKTASMTYTPLGQIATVRDPLGNTVSYTYSGPDLVNMSDALGRTVEFRHDSIGRLTSVTDPLGRKTTMQYDVMDRVVQITDPTGGITTMQYDGEDNLVQLTDPSNKVFKWAYDWADRVSTQTDPLAQVEAYAYDLNGNPTTFTDRKNQTSTSTYDALDRLTAVTDPVGTITYAYDSLDRLTSLTEGSRVISYGYNALDQLISETTPEGTVAYTYDALNQRTGMTVNGGNGITYAYDAANRITGMTRGTQSVSFAYDDADRMTKVTLPNGMAQRYIYDVGSQLTEIQYLKSNAAILGNLTYSYDASGQRTGMGGSYARTLLPTAINSATYDANNRLTNWSGSTLTYDSNGNLTGDGTYTYVWNARDQLIQVKQGSTVLGQYAYDAKGRRISRILGSTATTYQYDDSSVIRENVSGNNTDFFGLGVDNYFSRTNGNIVQTYLKDALNSTLSLTDGSGSELSVYTYGPYGQTVSGGSGGTNSNGYTGREIDVGGLYYYRSRYYSTQLNRFINQDTISLAGGVNWYNYVNQNPISEADPFGLASDMDELNIPMGGSAGYISNRSYPSVPKMAKPDMKLKGVPLNKPPISCTAPEGAPFSRIEIPGAKFNQVTGRGWSLPSIKQLVGKPFTTRMSATPGGKPATAYYNEEGDYVVIETSTGKVVQMSRKGDTQWTPDPRIVNPYKP